MERAAFSRLLEYLQENNLLDSRQSAYRPNHSVETLLTDLTGHMLMQMDTGIVTALVLLDMSSAFDTVEHSILTERLRSFGVGGLTLNWFKSYLSDRSQYVRVNDATSEPTPLTSSVLQGSVCLLFSLYLRPISDIILKHNVHYHCYTDDIQLYVSFPPSITAFSTTIRQLELCIDDVKLWMERNSLKLNDCKSEFMVLGSKQMLSGFQYINVSSSKSFFWYITHYINLLLHNLLKSLHVYHPSRRLRSSNSSSHTLPTPTVEHSWGSLAFSYMGPKLWNDLPHSLRQTSSLTTFKSTLKLHLIEAP